MDRGTDSVGSLALSHTLLTSAKVSFFIKYSLGFCLDVVIVIIIINIIIISPPPKFAAVSILKWWGNASHYIYIYISESGQ